MCGIAGVVYRDPSRPVDRAVLRAMADAIAHRGPDADGYWIGPGVGLAHRRLSIIDVAGSDQPIGNEDGSLQVVFNGELYNYPSLRERLLAAGHQLKTRGDTETLVHLYEDHGADLVSAIRGMFAFALWDSRRRRLLLARDRVGIKPLYLYRDDEKLIFGSEIKALLAHPGVDRDLNLESLEDYIGFGMVAGPSSIFRRIEKLPPGHLLDISHDSLRAPSRMYWSLKPSISAARTTDEWLEAVRAKVDECVRIHLIADVPVGAFLSGGVDSSVVVARAAGQAAEPIQTFSMGFQEEAFSELPYAREVAERFHTIHRDAIVTPDALQLVDDIVKYYDEPFADTSAIPTFLVSSLAKQYVKVVLSGDGGDEAFGGYTRYAHDAWEAKLRQRIPAWIRHRVLPSLSAAWPKADRLPRPLRAKTLLTNLSLDPAAAYANSLAICRPPLRRELLKPLARSLNGYEPGAPIQDAYRTADPDDAIAAMIAADVTVRLPDDYLVKVDRASMAHGLEVRPPLLDHELLELTASIPSDLKVANGATKWIFKEAYRADVPSRVTTRKKQGFEIPIDRWLRGPLREMFESVVLAPGSPAAEVIDQATARRIYTHHVAGSSRQGPTLWSLLVLARWIERYRPSLAVRS